MFITDSRNKSLYEDRLSGMTYNDLSIKYNITRERCRQIFLKYSRLLNQSKIKGLYGTKTTVQHITSSQLKFYFHSRRRKFTAPATDEENILKMQNLIDVYSEVLK